MSKPKPEMPPVRVTVEIPARLHGAIDAMAKRGETFFGSVDETILLALRAMLAQGDPADRMSLLVLAEMVAHARPAKEGASEDALVLTALIGRDPTTAEVEAFGKLWSLLMATEAETGSYCYDDQEAAEDRRWAAIRAMLAPPRKDEDEIPF